eukprot:TRINITY_DN18832_c0_g2_i1.p1 TRINITY_DN18832_c0_g2~~TRINITY_DN18832_c0_g2_i1.p1  ORF type:complete len:198 (+),score=-26.47 TRINITY_DN18832_c0_g2_i1:27-620(+)
MIIKKFGLNEFLHEGKGQQLIKKIFIQGTIQNIFCIYVPNISPQHVLVQLYWITRSILILLRTSATNMRIYSKHIYYLNTTYTIVCFLNLLKNGILHNILTTGLFQKNHKYELTQKPFNQKGKKRTYYLYTKTKPILLSPQNYMHQDKCSNTSSKINQIVVNVQFLLHTSRQNVCQFILATTKNFYYHQNKVIKKFQ